MFKRIVAFGILFFFSVNGLILGDCFASLAMTGMAQAEEFTQGGPLKEINIEQKLNTQLPLDAVFRDEAGAERKLGEFFGQKPVVLAFVYYECPMLCTLVLNGLLKALRVLKFTAGNEFDVVVISFDPTETPQMAADKKKNYLAGYGRAGAEKGWHFLTGEEGQIKRVTEAAGFKYVYDAKSGDFAHASAIMVATPHGILARYFYGIEYSARDLRWALIEASKEKIGSIVDQILLFCYHYDPAAGRYSLLVMNVLRVLGILTVIGIAALMIVSSRTKKVS